MDIVDEKLQEKSSVRSLPIGLLLLYIGLRLMVSKIYLLHVWNLKLHEFIHNRQKLEVLQFIKAISKSPG